MRNRLLLPAVALLAWGCSDSTESKVPTSVVINPTTVTLRGINSTQVVRASVTDQDGERIADPDLTWSSSSPAVTVVGAGGDSAIVTAARVGLATLTAQSGSASGTAEASVIVNGNLSILAGGFQAGLAGTVLRTNPTVSVRDSIGNPLVGIIVNFAVTSGGGSVSTATAVTNASGVAATSGWQLGPTADINTLTASSPSITGGPVTFRGIGCSGAGGAVGYTITLCITTPMTSTQRAAFTTAADRWARVVTGDLPDISGAIDERTCGSNQPAVNFVYDDLVIFAASENIDGPGQVLGQAGPCFVRTGRGLPVIGVMEFDAADLASLETNNQLGNVILHEMGHVLGIGSLWDFFGLLQNPSTETAELDTHYTGSEGRAAFDLIGGSTYTGGSKVPAENRGGAGTRNAHWRESVLRNELMTGFLNAGSNPLSVLTVRSLADLGYVVDPSSGDNFFLTLSLRAEPNGRAIELHDDLYRGPRYTIGTRGQIARVR